MENTRELESLISAAVGRLQAGDTPDVAYIRLASTGGDVRLTAVAVCAACGTSVSEAEQRLLGYSELFDEVSPGEENIIGEVLEVAGYFDHRVELDEAGTEIAKVLQEALRAAGPAPSGLAHNVHRWMTARKLPQAFLSIEALWSRRTPKNAEVFWAHMANAARLLADSKSPGFAEAAERCQDRLHDCEEALASLQDAATLWSVGSATAADVIEAACDCLTAGTDSPTLRIVAGISPRKGSESDELRRWLEDALAELSLTYYREGSKEGEEEALRIMARRLLAGTITPRDLTSWAYRFITWEGTPLADELIALENAYGYVDVVYEGHKHTSTTAEDLDADVIAEARRLIGDTTAEND
ncbi:hypothetical protein [Micromonospora echinofusca]|uniref:Uncharacterized protein n=1 Tax=Micromonospora echinofusca TaxID=47858 RepID=A0ABS3VJK4_MICEH|nr:hypothetical protein [Micromonospora echinofusca]MBO4204658.1 hypothetical protein [Micromonospora echinofusca]